jgi:hypothetical protein
MLSLLLASAFTLDVSLRQDPRLAPDCRDWTAVAVFEAADRESSEALLAGPRGARHRVRQGSSLGELRVAGIGYNSRRMTPTVWLWDGRALCQATFESRPHAEHRAARAPASRPAASTVQIDEDAVSRIVTHFTELTRGVRVVPRWADGHIREVALYGIEPGSLLHGLGLRNGDRVLGINGRPVTSVEEALTLYARLETERRYLITIARGKTKTELEWLVR